MKKRIESVAKKVKAFFVESWHYNFAPFTVYNADTNATHYAYTWADALEWLGCYATASFGRTVITDRRGEFVASN